jgi:hypothetical protein
VALTSSSTSGDGFARDERVERRRTSEVSFSLATDAVDVVRLRLVGREGARAGAGWESSSERDAEASEAAG